MATKKISALPAAVGIDGTNDVMPIVQSGTTNKISRNTLLGVSGTPADISSSQTFTNKVLDNTNTVTLKDGSFTLNNTADTTKVGKFSLSGNTTSTTRTYTLPNASVTLASLTGTETFTNKTITSPAITGGTIDNSTITVDSISGHSVAANVTVGGVALNNGVVSTASSVTSTAIAAGAVQPNALVASTGTGWAWTSFTPSFTNVTVGNGTATGFYIQSGKTVTGIINLVFGTTTSVTGAAAFTAPVTGASAYNNGANFPVGTIAVNAIAAVIAFNASATRLAFLYQATAGTGTYAGVDATHPQNPWAAGNIWCGNFEYQAA